ncbi:sulfotransferase [Geojedonia litorea]|uniref:Sulfotransferase n=2 Tax=Geojedonia litorea TaxID=1268269 RepID=A0ABV9N160_9FLAO
MSHMRSGSSLLEHILSTNDQILGIGEQNRIYRNKTDLELIEYRARWVLKKFLKRYKYSVDQILHSEYISDRSILKDNSIKCIFLIRKPMETISSIENLGGYPYNINNRGKFNSINYYNKRVSELIQISRLIPANSQFFLTYNELISKPDETLQSLRDFLELKTPLTKEYKLKPTTGKMGDRSENIKAGTIILTKSKTIKLGKEICSKLVANYKKAYNYFNFKQLLI